MFAVTALCLARKQKCKNFSNYVFTRREGKQRSLISFELITLPFVPNYTNLSYFHILLYLLVLGGRNGRNVIKRFTDLMKEIQCSNWYQKGEEDGPVSTDSCTHTHESALAMLLPVFRE